MAKTAKKQAKTGRPRSLIDGDVRDRRLNLRITDDEYDAILVAAINAQRTVSDYVRLAALDRAKQDASR